MPANIKAVPEGFRTVTPYLIADDADAVTAFLEKAFGATFDHKPVRRPDGKLMHASMRVGDTMVMIGNSSDRAKALVAMLYVYVPNVDEVYAAAVKAGGKPEMEPMDMFYGDRSGAVADPAGNHWWIATHIEDVGEAELEKRATEMMKR